MTRKDYEALAAWLRTSADILKLTPFQREFMAQSLCQKVLLPDNVRFDPHKFMNAVCSTGLPVKEDKS